MNFPFYSTKTWHQAFPVAYRQWRADSHCNVLHGYALTIHLEFGGFDLDARNWLVDFGGLRPLKAQLEDWFDHTMLVAEDDPQRDYLLKMHDLKLAKVTAVERTGCEGLSDFIFEHLNGGDGWLKDAGYWGRVICTKVEVRETDSNMAMRTLSARDYERLCGTVKEFPRKNLKEGVQLNYGQLTDSSGALFDRVVAQEPGYTFSAQSDRLFLLRQDAIDAMLSHYGVE